jgi:hypothetical protein
VYNIIGNYSLQDGFQIRAARANAQINILGGSAGCGKTFFMLLAPFLENNMNQPTFQAAIFRRVYSEITTPGGLLSESDIVYSNILGKRTNLKWKFPTGASIEFRALQYEKDVHKFQGSQIPFIGFDELTLFTAQQFWYMMSRNRSATIPNSIMYATCNPDPDSFVAKLISWWIDTDGFPIMERSGINRYFIRLNDHLIWGGTRNEVIKEAGEALEKLAFEEKKEGRRIEDLIKSITFIPGKLSDNKILNENDPTYRANLIAMSEEDKMRYLEGNWKIKCAGNMLFDVDKIEGLIDYTAPPTIGRFITCDAAKFGRDLMVIYVWFGWNIIAISIQKKSDPRSIHAEIERLRSIFSVMRNKTIIDADGVGNDVVKLGKYESFHGGSKCRYDTTINKREAYKNFKTQCFYRIAKRVNEMTLGIMCTNGNIWVDGSVSNNILINNEVLKVTDLIKKHLRAIRKENTDSEGKYTINSKDDQKIILDGASPDFADTLMMREAFEFDKPIL